MIHKKIQTTIKYIQQIQGACNNCLVASHHVNVNRVCLVLKFRETRF